MGGWLSAEEPEDALDRITAEVVAETGFPEPALIDQRFFTWLTSTTLADASGELTGSGSCGVSIAACTLPVVEDPTFPGIRDLRIKTRRDGKVNASFTIRWRRPERLPRDLRDTYELIAYDVYLVREDGEYERYRLNRRVNRNGDYRPPRKIKFRHRTAADYEIHVQAIYDLIDSTASANQAQAFAANTNDPTSKGGDTNTRMGPGGIGSGLSGGGFSGSASPVLSDISTTAPNLYACLTAAGHQDSKKLEEIGTVICVDAQLQNADVQALDEFSTLHTLNISNTSSVGLFNNDFDDLSALSGLADLYSVNVSRVSALPGPALADADGALIVTAQNIGGGLGSLPDLGANGVDIVNLDLADNNISSINGNLTPPNLAHLDLSANPVSNGSLQSTTLAVESLSLRNTNIQSINQASSTLKNSVKYLDVSESPLNGSQDFSAFNGLCMLEAQNITGLNSLANGGGQTTLPQHLQLLYASGNSNLATVGNVGDYVGGQNYVQIDLSGANQLACPEIGRMHDYPANHFNPQCPLITIAPYIAFDDCMPVTPVITTNSHAVTDNDSFQLGAAAFDSNFFLGVVELQECAGNCSNPQSWVTSNDQPADFMAAWTLDLQRSLGEYQFRIQACTQAASSPNCAHSPQISVSVVEPEVVTELEHIWIDDSPQVRTFKLAWRMPLFHTAPDYFRIRPGLTQVGSNQVAGDVLYADNVGNRIWHSQVITAGDFLGAVYSVQACVGSTSENYCGEPVAINLQTSTPGHELADVQNVDYILDTQGNNTFQVTLNYSSDHLCIGGQPATATRPDHFQIASAVNGSSIGQINIPGGQCTSSFTSATLTNTVPGSAYTVAACTATGDCSEASLITLLGAPTDTGIPAPDWVTTTINPTDQRQFELSWTQVADVDYYKVIEDGEQVDQVFITEDTSIQLQRYNGGDYSFTLMACRRDRDNGDTCGLEQTQTRTASIDLLPDVMQNILINDNEDPNDSFGWAWEDQSENTIRLYWGYFNVDCSATYAIERFRPDYYQLENTGNVVFTNPIPTGVFELVDASNGDGNCIWQSPAIDLDFMVDFFGTPQYTWEISACKNDGNCGDASTYTVDLNNPIGSAPLNDQLLETNYWDAPPAAATRNVGPAELSPGLWHDPDYISTGWNFYFASHARYARVLEQYGDSYDLLAVWYAHIQRPVGPGGNMEWSPAWFYALMKQDDVADNYYEGALIFPNQITGGIEPCDQSGQCSVGMVRVTFDTNSNTSAEVHVNMNSNHGLAGIDDKTFNLTNIASDGDLFGCTAGDLPENPHDHYSGFWWRRLSETQIDNSFITASWVESFLDTAFIATYDDDGYPVWVSAVNDDRVDQPYTPPAVVPCESTNLAHVHDGLTREVPVRFITKGINPILPAPDSYAVADHRVQIGDFARIFNDTGEFADQRTMGMYADFDHSIGGRSFSFNIGTSTAPEPLEKVANLHSIRYFVPGSEFHDQSQCEMTNGVCPLSLDWFTDDDYPEIGLFLYDEDSNDYLRIACAGSDSGCSTSHYPVVLDYAYNISNQGNYHFELWKYSDVANGGPNTNVQGNAMIARSGSFAVVDNLIDGGGGISNITPPDINSSVHTHTSHNAAVGVLTGSAGTSGGAATYSIPVTLPPGRAGMQPAVGINYNSRSGNSPVGMGWSLAAGSAISRCPATVAQDEYTVGITFTDTDRLCLDGQRLIRVGDSSPYWQANGEYRTEIDSFSRIRMANDTSGDQSANNNLQFEIEHKDGTIAYYGETTASIAKAHGSNDDRASSWLLSRQVDRSGNSIHYLYAQQGESTDTGAQAQTVTLGTGETVLSAIAYTGGSAPGNRRVEFTYAGRCIGNDCDVYESYVAGYRSEQTVSLSHIKTCVDNNANNACDTTEIIRDYELAHQLSGATGRLLLQSVTESACLNGSCEILPATTFTWGDTAQTYSYGKVLVDGLPLINDDDFNFETWHDNSTDQQPPRIGVASDFDGDGNNDWLVSMGGELYLMGVSAEQQELGRVRARSVSGEAFIASSFSGAGGDFNNDGRMDLMGVMVNPATQQHEYAVSQWKNTQFWDHQCTDTGGAPTECMLDDLFDITFTGVSAGLSVDETTGVSSLSAIPHPGDYDGDGSNDIMIMTHNTSGQDVYRIYYNLDSTSSSFVDILVPTLPVGVGLVQPSIGDYDGDGRTDILVNGQPNVSEGLDFGISLLGVMFNNNTDTTPASFTYFATSPHGNAGDPVNHLGMDFDPTKTFHLQTDINGDGLADLVFLPAGEHGDFTDTDGIHSWHYQINTGQRGVDFYADAIDTHSTAGLTRVTDPDNANQQGFMPVYAGIISPMDWNSDGRSELLVPSSIFQSACIIQRQGPHDNGKLYCPADPNLIYHATDPWLPGSAGGDPGCTEVLGGTDPQFCETYNGGLGHRDPTVYEMDVLAFEYDSVNETYSIQVHADTGMKGGNTLGSGDLYGDGIADVFGVHGCFETLNSEANPMHAGVTDCTISSGAYPVQLQNKVSNDIAGQEPGSDRNYYSNSLQTSETEDTLDLLLAVEDGFDRMTDFSYAPLSASDAANRTVDLPLYTIPDRDSGDSLLDEAMTAGVVDEYFYFNSSMHVVSSMSHSNGLGNGFNTTYYGYEEAVYNTRGRGFQGFRVVHTMTDINGDNNDLWTTTRFHQVFPLSGRVRSAETRTRAEYNNPLSQPINTSDMTWSSVNTYPGVYFPRAASETSDSYDLDDRFLINTTSISRGYDIYGNLTLQTTISDDVGLMTSTTTLTNSYATDIDSWWINQLFSAGTETNVSYAAGVPGAPQLSKVVTTRYQWDQVQRLPVCVYTIGSEYSLLGATNCAFDQDMTNVGTNATRTITDYDSHGNPDKVYVLGSSMGLALQRLTDTDFGGDGYFATQVTNPMGHRANMIYDPREGNITQITDANGLVSKMAYDVFGREIQTWYPIAGAGFNTPSGHYAPRSSMAYQWCMDLNECVGNELYRMTATTDGAPVQHQYLDILNRAIRVRSGGFVGNADNSDDWVQVSSGYNARGQMTAQSEPGFGSSGVNTTYAYDELGRVTRSVNPEASATRYTHYNYDGLTTQIWTGAASAQPSNCSASLPANAITPGSTLCMMRTIATTGWLLRSIDAHGEATDYWYDGQGSNVIMEDPDNNRMVSTYNHLGQRTAMNDPNQGNSTYVVNGLGEVTSQTNARGQVFTMDYDHIGRMISRSVNTGSGTIADSWLYDFGVGDGLLAESARAIDGVRVWSRDYSYDSAYRPQGMITDINGELFNVATAYDPYFARPYARSYPNNGMNVYTTYDQNGYPEEEGLASQFNTGEFLHRMDRLSERGQTEQITYGNGLVQEYDHYNSNGQMQQVWLSPQSSGENLIHISYGYDHFGNLMQQTQMGGATEDYIYDHLHRLKTSTRTNVPVAGTVTVNYGYDRLGNMTSKSDFATSYTYNQTQPCGTSPAGPNAVTQVSLMAGGSLSYGYDASGNQVCDSSGSQMAYDPYNQPTSIDKNGALALFDYSSDGQRYRQTGTVGEVIYIDKMYERHNQTKHQYYVGEYAVVTDEGAGLEISYLHGDRLGSMIAISDASGNINVDEQRGFDPFGKPRDGDWSDNDTSGNDLNGYDRTTRGFTGHEHLNGTEIIHMNGRTYDYNLGRFMSVDPIIQAPANSQSMNPYSYIMNNPLSGTDPSGYTAEFEDRANSGAGGDAGAAGANVNAIQEKAVTATSTGSRIARKVGTYTDNGNGTGTFTSDFTGRSDTVTLSSGANASSPTTETGGNPQGVGGAGDAPSNNNDTVQNAMGQHQSVNEPLGVTAGGHGFDPDAVPDGAVVGSPEQDKQAIEILDGLATGKKIEAGFVVLRDGTLIEGTKCTNNKCSFELKGYKASDLSFVVHTHAKSKYTGALGKKDEAAREYPGPGDHQFPVIANVPNYYRTPKGNIRVLEYHSGHGQNGGHWNVRTILGDKFSQPINWKPD